MAIFKSRNFANIVNALAVCKSLNIPKILFSDHVVGKVIATAGFTILASEKATSTVQELHIIFVHKLCEAVEAAIFPY